MVDKAAERLAKEIAREPRFERYPAIVSLDHAVEVTLEMIEEWDSEIDRHGWCHERPIFMTLVKAILEQV